MLLDELKEHYNRLAYRAEALRIAGKYGLAQYYEGSRDECYYLMVMLIGYMLELTNIEYEGVQIYGFSV